MYHLHQINITTTMDYFLTLGPAQPIVKNTMLFLYTNEARCPQSMRTTKIIFFILYILSLIFLIP